MNNPERERLLQLLTQAYHKFLPFHQEIESLQRKLPPQPVKTTLRQKLWHGFFSGKPRLQRYSGKVFVIALLLTGRAIHLYIDGAATHMSTRLGLIGAPLAIIFGYAYFAIGRRNARITTQSTQRIETLWAEIRHQISAWPQCPVGPMYTHPLWLDGIYRAIENGRADSVKEAIYQLNLDRQHSEYMEAQARVIAGQKNLASEIAWNTVFTIALLSK